MILLTILQEIVKNRALRHMFACRFCEILETPFSQNTSRWLLQHFKNKVILPREKNNLFLQNLFYCASWQFSGKDTIIPWKLFNNYYLTLQPTSHPHLTLFKTCKKYYCF